MATTGEPAGRWALMIGINYYPNDRHLYGSVGDVNDIKKYLEQHSTTPIHTSVLTATVPDDCKSCNDPPEPFEMRPTRANVLAQLRRIIDSAKSGDHVYIHFSGHGTQLPSDGKVGETGFGELGLVLFENDQHGASYFRGRSLAQALKKMVDNGLVITVVLDCCFSGAVSRGDHDDGFGIRTMEYDPVLDVDRLQRDQECQLSLGGHGRDARIDRDWLVDPQGYTIVTACGPHEKALEVLVNKQQKRGALTYHLLNALTTLSKLQKIVSHHALHEMVVSMMRSSGCSQTAMRYGNTRFSFFGSLLDSASLTAFPVHIKEDSTLLLKAGQVHGVSVGDEFALYRCPSPDPTTDGVFEVSDGSIFELTIENHADQSLYVAIFGFDPCWGVENLVVQSGGDDYALVPPAHGQHSGSKEIQLRMTIPTDYQPRSEDDKVRDVIKLFITNKPIAFPSLLLRGLRVDSSCPRDSVANAEVISDFFKLLNTESGVRSDRDTEAWMSHNFIVRTSIK
ncbi:hypothetical protein ACHAPJ_012736 [Fusarium lateritium]